ncbi:MAG: aminodeoxychorismate synthase component I [Spirochaetes bacterium]|nr:aminodeoxychorismate synthase component I [Spirochaetota bacterium]
MSLVGKSDFPLALFCAYETPAVFDHKKNKFISGGFSPLPENQNYEMSNINLNVSEREYLKNIDKIREYIKSGEIYQANYTIKYHFNFSGSPLGLYNDLKKKQSVAYNAFAKFDDFHILSISPELFFRKKGNIITVKPMKGTVKRGKNAHEDSANSLFLNNDEKNRSENIMIVDLLRNDLGRISKGGSVKVKKLYEVERYNTLFQMTSTVKSTLLKGLALREMIQGIFPSGSITGAPKIRSMEIINELENEKRNVYTGAIGFFEPSGDAVFNVAIRTVLLRGSRGEMGIGGGIVYDSSPESEFQECRLKGNFLLQKPAADFQLIETILFDKKYHNPGLHLKRLKDSAIYFDYKFSKKDFLTQLKKTAETFNDGRYRVRVLLDKSGSISISNTLIGAPVNEYTLTVSPKRTDSEDLFLYHKTTNRALYSAELEKARENNFFDILFFNEKDELTEGSITNVYISKNGIVYTPPVRSGLLNGTVRQDLISKNKAVEKIITRDELETADAVYISNAIIGFQRAKLDTG